MVDEGQEKEKKADAESTSFNPTMVDEGLHDPLIPEGSSFNPTMVDGGPDLGTLVSTVLSRFNPTMVDYKCEYNNERSL